MSSASSADDRAKSKKAMMTNVRACGCIESCQEGELRKLKKVPQTFQSSHLLNSSERSSLYRVL